MPVYGKQFSMRKYPNVGLFWFDKDKSKIILHRYADKNNLYNESDWLKLLESARGKPNPYWISVVPRHRELWNKLSEEGIIEKLGLPKKFDELPRGRLLYDKEDKKFILYYGNWLNEKTLKLVCDKFHVNPLDVNLLVGYNPVHYHYEGAEKDQQALEDFLVEQKVVTDARY